tara:strand:- start:151 stop:393 length:243 start_codon:yes stop_codon:yes gene_type:complete
MSYIVFCKPTCPFCVSAVELLENKNKTFRVVDFNDDQLEILEDMKLAFEWPTVPMVFHREGHTLEFIGGYTDLTKHLENV